MKPITTIILLLALLIPGSVANSSPKPDGGSKLFPIHLGAVESLRLPRAWSDSSGKSTSADRYFRIRPASKWDESLSLTVTRPYPCAAETLQGLTASMLPPDHELRLAEFNRLHNLLEPGVHKQYLHFEERIASGSLRGESRYVRGKRVLIIEKSGTYIGPCIWISKNERVRPRMNYNSVTLYLPLADGKIQEIRCSADSSDEVRSTPELKQLMEGLAWR